MHNVTPLLKNSHNTQAKAEDSTIAHEVPWGGVTLHRSIISAPVLTVSCSSTLSSHSSSLQIPKPRTDLSQGGY